jgi:hypothetical protein
MKREGKRWEEMGWDEKRREEIGWEGMRWKEKGRDGMGTLYKFKWRVTG